MVWGLGYREGWDQKVWGLSYSSGDWSVISEIDGTGEEDFCVVNGKRGRRGEEERMKRRGRRIGRERRVMLQYTLGSV